MTDLFPLTSSHPHPAHPGDHLRRIWRTPCRQPPSHGPQHWQITTWQAPAILPPVIDYPEDYLPSSLPPADLILSFAEHRGVAELLPDIAQMTGAQAVIAAIDNEAWLPRGLARQLRGWLERIGVGCATPKPLCSLTEDDFGVTRRQRIAYDHPLIREFARYFGQPEFEIEVDPETRQITAARVRRDAVCGCARYVAEESDWRLCRRCRRKSRSAAPPFPLPGGNGQRYRFWGYADARFGQRDERQGY